MLAIIPARGGSKGIPDKNIKLLCGKPLIVHTIEAALAAKSIDRIIISTDDEKIARLARAYNVEVPFMRPNELAQDDSLAIDNYIYTMDRLNKESGKHIESFVVLQPTSPLRSAQDIDNAVKLFLEKKADSVISCTMLLHPAEWICAVTPEGIIHPNKSLETKRAMNRQSLAAGYIPNGAVYVFNLRKLKERYSYYSDLAYAYVMPPERSVDIDIEADLRYAEFLLTGGAYAQ